MCAKPAGALCRRSNGPASRGDARAKRIALRDYGRSFIGKREKMRIYNRRISGPTVGPHEVAMSPISA